MIRRLPTGYFAACAVLVIASTASAWDSVARPFTRHMPSSPKPFFGIPAPFVASGSQSTNFLMSTIRDSIGGMIPDRSDDTSADNVLLCDSSFQTLFDGSDLSMCTLATSPFIDKAKWAWLEIRKQANRPNESEHYLIAQASASFAGFDATTLFNPFWVRYPAQNALVASPRDVDENENIFVLDPNKNQFPSPYLVGQSLTPAASILDSTQSARDVSLLELAQLPDFSNSLADWAAGNEICPIPESEGAFNAEISPVQACHQFDMLLGSINITHFAPLNRQTWRYYHHLAVSRMADCTLMAAAIAPFYARSPIDDSYQVLHANQSETHECESEAMAYEMFAQHFMQDNWATGHMWKRWGHPNFRDFPADVTFFGASSTFLPEAKKARRATIALLTAAISGTIHGAKPIITHILRDSLGGALNFADRPGFTDDPLSAPKYFSLLDPGSLVNTEWLSPDNRTFPGAGDLFWDPLVAPQGSVNSTVNFIDQRTAMVRCGAASMLQAYNAGPHAHGNPSANLLLDGVEPDSDECWNHWATNGAMLGALGAFNFIFDPVAQFHAAALVNTVIESEVQDKTALVRNNAIDAALPNFDALILDKIALLSRLRAKVVLDGLALHTAYLTNAITSPLGTESAKGIAPDQSTISLLDSEPIADVPVPPPTNAPPPSPATSYADVLLHQDAALESLPAPGTLGSAVSKMFWRGNLGLTCRTSVASGSQELLALRNQCVASAIGGGSPDACTACTELAEIHVPRVNGEVSPPVVGDSKCSAIGVESTASPPTGLPAYWFNSDFRNSGGPDHTDGGLDLWSFYVAMQWCTGTKLNVDDSRGPSDGLSPLRDSLIGAEVTGTAVCPNPSALGGSVTISWGVDHRRQAQALVEDLSPDSAVSIFPIVSTFDYDYEQFPSGDPCKDGFATVDGRKGHFGQAIPDGLVSQFFSHFSEVPSEELQGGEIVVPRCGVQQRVSYWNRGCDVASAQLGIDFHSGQTGHFAPSTGEQQLPVDPQLSPSFGPQTYCFIREKRTFKAACPSGYTCTAGGECNAGAEAPSLEFITTAPPPPPRPPSPPTTTP